jgi:hypothetical protein
VYRQFIAEAPAGTIRVKIIQIQEVPVPSLLKENPLLCHEADAALKKKSHKLCITNKYKYKIDDKIYPIQHSARSDN